MPSYLVTAQETKSKVSREALFFIAIIHYNNNTIDKLYSVHLIAPQQFSCHLMG